MNSTHNKKPKAKRFKNRIHHTAAYKKHTLAIKIGIFSEQKTEKIFQSNYPKKQAGITILISNKIDFQPKLIKSNRERYFILIEGKIYQDDISILNIYAPKTRVPTFVKETLLKFKLYIKPHTLMEGDSNTLPSPIDRASRQKLNREIMKLIDIMNQMDLIYTYRIFYPNTKEYTFFSVPHGSFSNIDHVVSQSQGKPQQIQEN
jgi:exonuclease III